MKKMFESLIGNEIKAVWKDKNLSGENKAIKGVLVNISGDFIHIEQEGKPHFLNINAILSLKLLE